MDLGLKQKDVAKIIGTSPDTITNWERGRTQPDKKYHKKCKSFIKGKRRA
jgi:DNA-binding transcriptional regulator YiaG